MHQPRMLWRVCGGAAAVAMAFGAGSAAVAAQNATVTIDQQKAQYGLDQVVNQVRDACAAHPDDDLTVEVRQPTYEFSDDIVCSGALAFPDKFIRAPLVKKAARHQDADERARAVGDAYAALPPIDDIGYDYDSLVWGLAAHDPKRCQNAENPKKVQRNMSSALQSATDERPGESPAHWTLVEAMWVLGFCPERLPALYESVAALGNPIAAKTVEAIMAREPVTLPLSSVPLGISARTVAGRPVFLDRRGKHVTAFLTDVHHELNEKTLWYCPRERVFASPTHAEMFDESGRILGGPASRGLDRFKTTVRDGRVTVHLDAIQYGNTTHGVTSPPAAHAASTGAWDSAPESFCFEAVKNTITPFG